MDDINPPNQNNQQQNPPPAQPAKETERADNRPRRRRRWFFARVFWGAVIIFIGIVLLAHSLGYIAGFHWGFFFAHVWPIFIIFLGLSILSRGNWVIGILAALAIVGVFVLVLYGLISRPAQNSHSFTGRLQDELLRLQQPPPGYYYDR